MATTDHINFLAFVEMAKRQQRDLNEKTVEQLNAMLADDRSGLVMPALEERAYFEDDARERSSDPWVIGNLTAQAEWALPRNEY